MDKSVGPAETILVLTNCPDEQSANEMARQLLEQKLAACVNIMPRVRSLYRWQGAIESADEITLLIKTVPVHYAQLEQAIENGHPYQVPEIIALPIIAGSSDYLNWLVQETRTDDDI